MYQPLAPPGSNVTPARTKARLSHEDHPGENDCAQEREGRGERNQPVVNHEADARTFRLEAARRRRMPSSSRPAPATANVTAPRAYPAVVCHLMSRSTPTREMRSGSARS